MKRAMIEMLLTWAYEVEMRAAKSSMKYHGGFHLALKNKL